MIEITTSNDPDEWKAKREPLFSIDGVEHTIPVEVSGHITIRAMEMYRTVGDAGTTSWVLEQLLGEDSYAALLACRSITRPQFRAIAKVCVSKVFGDPEDPDSESGKG